MPVRASGFSVSVPVLLFEPEFHVFDCLPDKGLTKFLVAGEQTLAQAPFIDIRFEPLAQAQFFVPTSELFALEGGHGMARRGPVFIFHHAFVCSTLLARCLNGSDAFFSLKEPWILRRLADLKRARVGVAPGIGHGEAFSRYVSLLCRTFQTGKTPVIKATNVANNLIEDVLSLLPSRRVLYLYSDLESFLVSTLKKSPDTQNKMPGLARSFMQDGDFAQRFPQLADGSRWTILQACALVWLVSLYNLQRTLSRFPGAALRTLDAQRFTDDPAGTLTLLSEFFGHSPDVSDLAKMTDRSILDANAKDPSRPYSVAMRKQEMATLVGRHARNLDEVRRWIEPAAAELGAPDFLLAHHLAR